MRKTSLFSVVSALALSLVLALTGLGGAAGKGKPGGTTTTPNPSLVYVYDGSVFVAKEDGSSASRVLSGYSNPSWIPDGSGFLVTAGDGIYFQAFDNDNGAASGSPLLIFGSTDLWGAAEMSPMPAPDGNYKIVYAQNQPNGTTDLFLVNSDGSGNMRLTVLDNNTETSPRWAPSGDRLVFDVHNFEVGNNIEIIDLGYNEATNQVEITDRLNLSFGLAEFAPPAGPHYPIWSRDGLSVLASGLPAYSSTSYDIFEIPIDNPADLVNITNSPSMHEFMPTLSPDGNQIMFRHRGIDPCAQKGKSWGLFSIAIRNILGTPIGDCELKFLFRDSGGYSVPDWK